MFLETSNKSKHGSFHRKVYSNTLEDTELNHRNYIILLSHFSDNLNISIKNLEDCISDLEQHPKFKISRSEKQLLQCGLQYLCQLYIDRVCKQSYYRNAVIRKNYNVFLLSYSVFLNKNKRQQYPNYKAFTLKSYSQNQRASQRSFINKQSGPKFNTICQRRSVKKSMLLGKSILHQPKFSTSQEKNNLEGSKMFSVKKAPINTNNSRFITISPPQERKKDNSDVKGSLVFVNRPKYTDEQFEYELQKTINKPVQSFSTNRVLAFRNRISTNPEQHEKEKGTKQGRMLRMSYMNIQSNSGNGKSKMPYQQQIKLILNINN